MGDLPGGASGLLVRHYKAREADRLVTRIDPGVVSLVAELRGHKRQAAEELGQWKTRDEERKPPTPRRISPLSRKLFPRMAQTNPLTALCRCTVPCKSNRASEVQQRVASLREALSSSKVSYGCLKSTAAQTKSVPSPAMRYAPTSKSGHRSRTANEAFAREGPEVPKAKVLEFPRRPFPWTRDGRHTVRMNQVSIGSVRN
jgi:hypothetical protein